MFVTW